MRSPAFYERKFPTDRWPVRAISPQDITAGISPDMGHPVMVHPGWGKSPERYARLLLGLHEAGFLAIGVDTRYGYVDRQLAGNNISRRTRLFQLFVGCGDTNPYFQVNGKADNRWPYRRPTSLLYIWEQLLGLNREVSLVGHSEGARISLLAALGSPETTTQVVVVNGAGTGDSSNGFSRLARSNYNQTRAFLQERDEELSVLLKSALGSTVYAATHLRRTWEEKRVIQTCNSWKMIDHLQSYDVPAKVLHAEGDEMISFTDSRQQAQQRPWVNFQQTPGTHNNVHTPLVHGMIIEAIHQGLATRAA